ncbi:MAG TPA: methylated-DNA--[protein]-cysteine S-methyltransferase [Gaiellales bacterium]|nr:methylated-DNA--[protein]-cysteine S-methyltransferase [Gaiellales bacterium]
MHERVSRLIGRAEAEGLVDVAYAETDTPVGRLLVAATPRGLVRVSFHGEAHDAVLGELAERLSPRVLEAPSRLDIVRRELEEYFEGGRREFDVPLDWSLTGSTFRRRVLERTAKIPYGATASYRDVASAAGNERAVRAAGTALGANPIPIVVPCHRVLRSGGALGGYGGGLEAKRFLLDLEAGRSPLEPTG